MSINFLSPDQCMEFCATELAEATRNYCRKTILGKGGYGVVYKGTLRYSAVAIKVLTPVSIIQLLFLSCSNLSL